VPLLKRGVRSDLEIPELSDGKLLTGRMESLCWIIRGGISSLLVLLDEAATALTVDKHFTE